jgi:hypothetical protein
MLRRPQIDHILRAAAAVTNHTRFVVVGTGAVIMASRRPVPASMMMTEEIDLYPDGVDDPDPVSDLIDGTIGQGSLFHRTFKYYGDGVSPGTAIMPLDWRSRAIEYHGPAAPGVIALCPDPNDVAIAKLCAWRDKDIAWLRDALVAGIVGVAAMRQQLGAGLPAEAPPAVEVERRLSALVAGHS